MARHRARYLLEATGWLLIGFVIIRVIAQAVFGSGRITNHRVIGAVLLYLTIGVVFVALYTLVDALAPGSFTGLKARDQVSLPPDLVYFSFTTLTTVGFGDVVPVHPFASSLCHHLGRLASRRWFAECCNGVTGDHALFVGRHDQDRHLRIVGIDTCGGTLVAGTLAASTCQALR
jgi:hypothetical protein